MTKPPATGASRLLLRHTEEAFAGQATLCTVQFMGFWQGSEVASAGFAFTPPIVSVMPVSMEHVIVEAAFGKMDTITIIQRDPVEDMFWLDNIVVRLLSLNARCCVKDGWMPVHTSTALDFGLSSIQPNNHLSHFILVSSDEKLIISGGIDSSISARIGIDQSHHMRSPC